jgi:hypothetical protein
MLSSPKMLALLANRFRKHAPVFSRKTPPLNKNCSAFKSLIARKLPPLNQLVITHRHAMEFIETH